VPAIVENAAMTAAATTPVIPRAASRLGALAPALAAALLAAGCSTPFPPAPPRPSAVPASTPSAVVAGKPVTGPVPLPAVPSEDETLPGVRYGATRAELLAAYPGAECTPEHCTGSVTMYGLPATFLVFAQPDGRWAASIAVSDATAAARAFAQVNAAMRERYLSPSEVEPGANLLRWRFDNIGTRQAVLRRCTPDQKCRGAPHTVVEVDFFYKGGPLAQPW
jgi:hypothetical protein